MRQILLLVVVLSIITACADRVADYHRFLERLADQVYLIPLYTEVNLVTVDKRVKNVLPHPNASANTWNIADWWVQG